MGIALANSSSSGVAQVVCSVSSVLLWVGHVAGSSTGAAKMRYMGTVRVVCCDGI
jgi:hypothetical protein